MGSVSQTASEQHQGEAEGVAEEDLMRAQVYGLLSGVLMAPPCAGQLEAFKKLQGDQSAFGQALSALGELARTTDPEDIEDEFTRLFYGHGAGGELHPYASYYLTGFIYERPLAELRNDLAVLGLTKSDATSEPEDHIAFLMNVMHDQISGVHGQPMGLDAQKTFYDKHVATWASRFFADLEGAENAAFFRPVGTIGKLLMEIENQAFAIAA